MKMKAVTLKLYRAVTINCYVKVTIIALCSSHIFSYNHAMIQLYAAIVAKRL